MDLNAVIDAIKMRGMSSSLGYFGASTPLETQFILENESSAYVVDVRTRAEWAYVGVVPDSIQIEWQSFPAGEINEAFLTQLQKTVPTDAYVMFLCRSGARSHAAASLAASVGYTKAINILDGFEGDKDSSGHRGTVAGWKFCGLPWLQG
ncbi:MAG: rhodanese-like domain-containing protein [Proteobacteria bacterium]|nr:rhodanese-like domain-containing protein [Pseudomonadota bacterium]MDA1332053.1 rhodanese-like domain-containing protein [Pseudomonadota bacterium]